MHNYLHTLYGLQVLILFKSYCIPTKNQVKVILHEDLGAIRVNLLYEIER